MEGIFKTGRIAVGNSIKYDKVTFTKNNFKFISNLLKCESTYALIFITFNNIQIDNK